MSPLKWLNSLFFLENLLGIYRNYCTKKPIRKNFIVFHIFILILIQTVIVIGEVYYLLIVDVNDRIKLKHINCDYVISSYITSLLIVVTSISHSRAFTSYIRSVNRVSKRFINDNHLNNSLNKLYWFGIPCVSLSIVFAVLRSLDVVSIFKHVDHNIYASICVPVFLSQALIRFTILFQKLVLFVVIMIVVNLSKCLNSLVTVVQGSVGSCKVSLNEQECDVSGEQIQEWVKLYRDIANCYKKVTLCFGRQFFFSLIMSVSYYILLTYQMCYLSVLNIPDTKIAIVIICYVLLTMLPIVAGQLARNQGMKFRRVLARLYNTMIVFDTKKVEAKLIKDFIILINKNPLEIKLLSKIPVAMYLLPVILMSTVNYVIVMLQFNNIV